MSFDRYWYIVAASGELTANGALCRCVLDERLVCFRGRDGAPAVLRDRCLHRNAPLSDGTVRDGLLTCPYHGWTYDHCGAVVDIPSMPRATRPAHCSPPFAVIERDGYIYVRLGDATDPPVEPFAMPHYRERGWVNLRLQNLFANKVSNCVENFIDIPHTAFVHRGLFRSTRGEAIGATIESANGAVHVRYENERGNLGVYRWFLNPRGSPIRHTDNFYAPNITSVIYELEAKTFIITSQAVPIDDTHTLVYTDLTYNFGWVNKLAAPLVKRHGQRIIDQDKFILARQLFNIQRYGAQFRDTPADLIHRQVDGLREAIAQGRDPRTLPAETTSVEFLV